MVDRNCIPLTNLDKILFPARLNVPPVSKRDFLKLIATISPYILFHIYNRPLTMIRAPSGLRSRSFYQKHWNLDIPDFLETVRSDRQDPAKKEQLLCNNIAALVFLAQNNILEYHCGLSRLECGEQALSGNGEGKEKHSLDRPDYLAFDIDFHKESESEKNELDQDAFRKTREAAQLLRTLLQSLNLKPFLKTSGRNGLHVFIPVQPALRFDELRVLAETIAKHLSAQHHNLISLNPIEARRSNKIFLDYHENTQGKTLAAPYTLRLTPAATISTPLDWAELDNVSPGDFNVFTITNRLNEKQDIWKDIKESREDLARLFTNNGKT
jgi:bifunctional non-homologous end joining protein LigD